MLPTTVPNLSQGRLSGLPDRNKDDFILNYLKEQRQLKEYYASCGPNVVLSIEPPQSSSAAANAAVFDTPLLKPRVPNASTKISQRVARPKESSIKPRSQETPNRQETGQPKRPQKSTVSRRDADEESNSDGSASDSHVERLAIRRERRRERKAMMAPPESRSPPGNDPDQLFDNAQESIQKKGKGKAPKQSTLPVGFALMHGFSATNVGKNRLTIDPPVLKTIGFFNRGRASDAAGPKQGKGLENGIQFSEQTFLTKTSARKSQRRSAKRKIETSGESDMDTDTSSAPRKPQKRKRKHKPGRQRKNDEDAAAPETHLDSSDQRPVAEGEDEDKDERDKDEAVAGGRESSIVWEIERSSAILASSVANISAGEPGSIVVMKLPPSLRPAVVDDHTPSKPRSAIVHGASPSLAPSESASQLPRNDQIRIGDPSLSRYFTANEATALAGPAPPPSTDTHQIPLPEAERQSTSKAPPSPRSSLLRSPVISHVPLPTPILPIHSASSGSWLLEYGYDMASCLNDRGDFYDQNDIPVPDGYDVAGSSSLGLPLATQQPSGSSMLGYYSCHPGPYYGVSTFYPSLAVAPHFDQGCVLPEGYVYSEPTALLPHFDVPQPGETTSYSAQYVPSGDSPLGTVTVDAQDLAHYDYYQGHDEMSQADEGDFTPQAYQSDEEDIGDVDASSEVDGMGDGLGPNQFVEGRALLYGLVGADSHYYPTATPAPTSGPPIYAEMDVAQQLRIGHWLPQRL